MPRYEFGDMWSEFGKPDTVFIFTANSTVKADGKLVMGRGMAKAVRDFMPGIDLAIGQIIKLHKVPDEYGFVMISFKNHWISTFQVKTEFADAASPTVICLATVKLKKYALEHPKLTINMNFPGIGNGRLPEDVVRPIIEDLPENVVIWKCDPALVSR